MSKPLFRFTVGPCLQQGLDILVESVKRTTRALGMDAWEWVICHNGLNREQLEFVRDSISDLPVSFYSQSWATCPVMDNCQTPRRKDDTFEWNGNRCGGTMWKVCPARMRMESHEIVMDNDVILLKKFPQIDEFLAQEKKGLCLEEPIRFYGRYDCLFGDPPYLNSGFMGFPPGYDFGSAIFETWVKHGRYMNLSQADEQGLLTYSLSQHPNIRVHADQMKEFLHRDFKTEITGREEGLHFTQSNRIPGHYTWKKYQELVKNATLM